MSVFKDEIGKWRYRCTVTHRDGSKERINGSPSAANTKLAAREAEDDHRRRAVNPPEPKAPEKAPSPGFSTFATKWFAAYPASAENRPGTIEEKEFHVRVHLKPYWKETPIDKIDSMAIAHMIGDLKKKPKRVQSGRGTKTDSPDKTLGAKTVRNIAQTLHKILATAHEWKILGDMPKFPKRKNTNAPWDFYTSEESALLLAATNRPARVVAPSTHGRREYVRSSLEDRIVLRFALRTGARAGEQLAVTWGDIDWIGRKVHFRRQYHRGEYCELKAGPSRSVDLSGDLLDELRTWRASQVSSLDVRRGLGSDAENSPRDLVFPLRDGVPREINHLRDILRRYSKRAGLRRIKWHELRHSFASQLVSGGVPLKQVQEWLGHSTIHMTMRYAHLAPSSGAGFIGVLDRPVSADTTHRPVSAEGS